MLIKTLSIQRHMANTLNTSSDLSIEKILGSGGSGCWIYVVYTVWGGLGWHNILKPQQM